MGFMMLIVTNEEIMAKTEGVQTLEDLKAENEATESEELSPPQADDLEEEIAEDEAETEELDEDAETEPEETDDTELEDWMKPDGHTSDSAEKKYTGSDIGAAKAKVRAKLNRKLEEKDSELAELRAEVEKLKTQPNARPTDLKQPKREDFYDHDDPDQAYIDAYTDWRIAKADAERDAKAAAAQTETQQALQRQKITEAVDQHVERAAKLSEVSNIAPEAFANAELKVRAMIDSLYPNAGDVITDGLIASLGEGSEKVMFKLGVDKSRLNELKTVLQNDPNGITAGVYLGELKKELTAPRKRKSTAPKPPTEIQGDKQSGDAFRALKKKYDAALKKNDLQTAVNVRAEARRGGADVKSW